MSDNYAEETQPLFKLLKNPVFRFIIVRYRNSSQVKRLEAGLRQRFQDRPSQVINLLDQSIDYHRISQAYVNQQNGLFLLKILMTCLMKTRIAEAKKHQKWHRITNVDGISPPV